MYSFPLKKAVLIIFSEFFLLSGIYLALMFFRFNQFGTETFTPCFEMGLDSTEMQRCLHAVVAYYINDSGWMAVQYTLLVIPAIISTWLFTRKIPGQSLLLGLTSGVVSAVLIWVSLEPPLLAALAAITGIPLGGLIAQSSFTTKPA